MLARIEWVLRLDAAIRRPVAGGDRKTGALFAAAAELGAIAAGTNAAMCRALGRYGLAIGVAFQHADDRDDAEHAEHADSAAQRILTLAAEANALARTLPEPARLIAIADWFASRA